MIIPIHGLRYYHFLKPKDGELIFLVKEKDNIYDNQAIAAYNTQNEKIGYVSAKTKSNQKVYSIMKNDIYCGTVWTTAPNQILVKLEIPNNTPPNKKSTKKGANLK